MFKYLIAILSTLFRIGSYLFLRVLPSSILRQILPVLYVLYLSTLFITPTASAVKTRKAPAPNGHAVKKDEVIQEAEAEPPAVLLTAVIFSIPSPARFLNATNLLINTVLFLFALDFVLYPVIDDASDVVFSRVGAVYPDAAKITIRYPVANASENQVRVLWRQASGLDDSTWNAGPLVDLYPEHDWANTTKLDGLWPSTNYEYILANADGTDLLSYPAEPLKFHTFPDPRLPTGSHYRFVVSSCATPNFPYAPLQGRRIKGYDLLANYLWPSKSTATEDALLAAVEADAPPAEFMLFLGDFIYADVPMYFGDNVEAYRRFYRRNYQSPSFRKVYERLPMFHTYDDHEIINNFAGQSNDSKPPFKSADDAFRIYNANANYDPVESDQHYYEFRYADSAFFVMDTRRHRSDVAEGDEISRTMLGEKQLAALYDWLGKVNETTTWKFVVSSVPFTSLWTYEAEVDSWNPYTNEKAALLQAMQSVKNVIVLSGDRHEFAAIKFNAASADTQSIVEVSTSPMSMFWVPFVRTLRPASEATVKRVHEVAEEFDGEMFTQVIEDEVPQEEVLKYVPEGNYKWSTFEVDTRDPQNPKVRLELMSDGKLAYVLDIAGKPVELRASAGLETFVPKGIKGVLDKLGLKPGSWW